jgi:putative transcriptional regulator
MGAEVAPVIVNRLSRLMGERRLSIQDVAEGTGLAYSGLHALYHDKAKRLDVETLNKLCNFFGVGPGEIFEWTPDETPAKA